MLEPQQQMLLQPRVVVGSEGHPDLAPRCGITFSDLFLPSCKAHFSEAPFSKFRNKDLKPHLPPPGLYPEPERAAVLMEVFLPSQWEKCPWIQFSSSVQEYLPLAFQRC